MSARVRAYVVGLILNYCRPRPKEKVWEWASENVRLDEKASPGHHGPYDWRISPLACAIQETHTDPDWDEDVTMKSSQAMITEGALNNIRWSVANAPMNALYVTYSAPQAKKICKVRMLPSLRACKATNKVIGDVHDDELSNQLLNLPGMVIQFTGGGSSGELTSNPFGIIIFDEADEHPAPPKEQIANVDAARERLKTVPGKKLYIIGRPKTTNHTIYQEYKTGTCEKAFVPCPHPLCGGWQELVFEQVKYGHCKDLAGDYDLQRVVAETYYECIHCGQPIYEDQKPWMVLQREWRVTNHKHKPRKRSRHISDLYSFDVKWSDMALEFIDAMQSGLIKKLQAFRTGRQGLPWEEKNAEVTEDDVLKLRGTYKRGSCPFVPDILLMAADKQGDILKWVIAGVRWPGEVAIVDYGHAVHEDELVEIAQIPRVFEGLDAPMTVKIAVIDDGYYGKKIVRPFCLRTAGLGPNGGQLFHPAKGRAGLQVKHLVWETQTDIEGEPIMLYMFDDDAFKSDLYITRILKFKPTVPGKPAPLNRGPRLHLPADVGRDFVSELSMEKLVEDKTQWGQTKFVWMKMGANDYGDGVKLVLVLWNQVAQYFKPTGSPDPESVVADEDESGQAQAA